MDSKGIKLSKVTKDRVDELMGEFRDTFDDSSKELRPFVLKLGFSFGLAKAEKLHEDVPADCGSGEWEMGSIISGDDLRLFRHLIVNEANRKLSDSEVKKYLKTSMEHGIAYLYEQLEYHSKSGNLEDFKVKILNQ